MIACTKTKRVSISVICILALLALMTGCTSLRRPPVEPVPTPPAPAEAPAPIPETPPPADPRQKASLQLSNQGHLLLQQERIDDAIRTLEQAISLYPQNGESYYYMAEAWLAKGSFSQAGEFNRLAEMYLDNPDWASRVNKQRRAIDFGNPSPE
jgi:tetratricopeptide (TPR) repeat protein